MVFKNLCILWTKVASALEGLSATSTISFDQPDNVEGQAYAKEVKSSCTSQLYNQKVTTIFLEIHKKCTYHRIGN